MAALFFCSPRSASSTLRAPSTTWEIRAPPLTFTTCICKYSGSFFPRTR